MIPHLWWRVALGRVFRLALTATALVVASGGMELGASLGAALTARAEQVLGGQPPGAYDILVRPVGSRTPLEATHGLLPPNHLNSLSGGIAFAQYEAIRALPDVELAAPLATLGYYTLRIPLRAGLDVAPGAHAVHCISQGAGPADPSSEQVFFYYLFHDAATAYGAYAPGQLANWSGYPAVGCDFEHLALLVAVDPGAEIALLGLDGAMGADAFPIGTLPSTSAYGERSGRSLPAGIPVLANASDYLEAALALRVEDVPLPPRVLGKASLEARGGSAYLQTLGRGDVLVESTLDAGRYFSHFGSLLLGQTMAVRIHPAMHRKATYAVVRADPGRQIEEDHLVVQYVDGEGAAQEGAAAELSPNQELDSALPVVIQGTFDPADLALRGTGTALLDTYGIPAATLRHDEEGLAVEPTTLRNGLEPRGYLTPPPTLLTTLEAARTLRGEDAISAVRVRVAGVERLSPETLERIASVATEIARRTGLEVDVVSGSSTRQVLVHVPGVGYVGQTWIERGAGQEILAEAQRATRWLAAALGALCSVLLVGVARGRRGR